MQNHNAARNIIPMHIRDRHLKPLADEAMRTFPAMMLLGARQVGKSTLTHLLDLPHARYTTLDDAVTLSSAGGSDRIRHLPRLADLGDR